jgi:Meiotically up-regulated gene 113
MARIRSIKPELWPRNKDVWGHPCCLYFIEEPESGRVKIGSAVHPIRRLSILQCGNSRPLTLRYVFASNRQICVSLERQLLTALKPKKVLGEWVEGPINSILATLRALAEID